MPFSAQELDNIASAALDFHLKRGDVKDNAIQNKPLLAAMKKAQKTFPGGKGNITRRVKGVHTTSIMGFTHDDTVTYQNPANIKTATVPWKEIHAGIALTMTELKIDGISVVDSLNGKNTSEHSDREMTALANLLDDKLGDMSEGWDIGFDKMLHQDGTQDAKQVPGIQSFILDDPTTATIVQGIDQAANTWWRNRASLAIDTSTPSNLNLTNKLQTETRQLRRYGGNPTLFLAGSDFIAALEAELRSKGNFTLEGWNSSKNTDIGMADVTFKGNKFVYDPTLDLLSRSKYAYLLDPKTIFPMVMDGEDMKQHSPARPESQYVMYRAVTWTGGLICEQRNANGVYSIA